MDIRISDRLLAGVLTVCGAVGALAAFVLTVEKIELITDPEYQPTCSINPILSCGSIMKTDQAEVFGFPNPLIGVATFPIVATIGVVLLTGARLPRWVWLGLNAGAALGVVFVHWLFFQSLYRIGALCPYCMVVWIITITAFWYVTLANLTTGRLPLPGRLRPAVDAVARWHSATLLGWFLVLTVLIGEAFWSYWQTLL